jgi:type IV pilus assembly protein PilQ
MRLKQLLGTILLVVGTTAIAAASVPQLSGVLVKSHDSAGIVTILANGPFTHTEYRPSDNLMLVDLAGVSIAHQDAGVHSVFAPGVRSYRVLGYRSPGGAETARIELNLLPGAKAEVSDIAGGVEVRITGAPAVPPSKEEIAAAALAKSRTSSPVQVRNVSVSRGQAAIDIELSGSGPLTYKTMKLTSPDRVVLDIPNSVLEGRPRTIDINSNGIRDVRIARFQDDPPTTRIVVDMAAVRDFDVLPSGNRLVLRVNGTAGAPAPSAVTTTLAVAPAVKDVPAPVVSPAAGVASLQTQPKAAVPQKQAEKPADTRSRADIAASRFAHDGPDIPSVNQPPYGASASLGVQPAAINAALLAQAAAPAPGAPAGVTNCTGGRYTGEPIGLNFKDLDLKDFFRVIQEISGLNVVLDPAVKGTVSIYLNDVPWDQALSIVLTNNGLECQLQGNVLRIATLETLKNEAEARRAQQEAQALAVPKQSMTRYLSYGQSKDAATIVKKFLSPRGDVVADPRSNALIIEDIPSMLPKIDQLIRVTLDRKTPEVEIEARVVASTRTFARDIGTQLGVSGASGNSAAGGATADSPIQETFPTGVHPDWIQGTKPGTIPLFSNIPATGPTSGFEFITSTLGFRLDFILTMAESRGLLKILSRPHVVTQNNIKALIRQGTRVPIVTQAQLGGPPTVQFIDAFLRLEVTPQITAENTIFLNVDVENTVPDFSHVTGTQVNPSLSTQQATTSVLVTDGGTVVIGGVIQTQNTVAINQVPLLGSIPMLGHLFKHTSVSTSTQELIFFITPKIIQT